MKVAEYAPPETELGKTMFSLAFDILAQASTLEDSGFSFVEKGDTIPLRMGDIANAISLKLWERSVRCVIQKDQKASVAVGRISLKDTATQEEREFTVFSFSPTLVNAYGWSKQINTIFVQHGVHPKEITQRIYDEIKSEVQWQQ